jgi:signal transduction histidine kinase/CheY-like chemotaxis protein
MTDAGREPAASRTAHGARGTLDEPSWNLTRFARLLAVLGEPAPHKDLLERTLATLSELFGADVAVLLDPAGTGTFAPVASIGLPEGVERLPLSGRGAGYAVRAMASPTPLLTRKAGSDPAMDPQLRNLGVEVTAWLSVSGSLSPRGVLILARCQPDPFAREDIDLLSAMTYRIGLSLEEIQRDTQLALIERYGRGVGRHLDEPSVVAEAMGAFPAVMGAEAAVLVTRLPDGEPRCAARVGVDPDWDGTWRALAQRLLKRLDNGKAASFAAEEPAALLEGLGMEPPADCRAHALLAVPLRRDDRTRGFLFALRFARAPFPPDALKAAMLFAGQTAAAVENARLYGALSGELAERRRAEEERNRLAARLQQAQRMEAVGTFAGGIAHDYNNLLLTIIGSLELAQYEGAASTELRAALEAAGQAAELTRKFMTFTEGWTPATAAAPVADLVRDAVTVALAGSNVRARYLLADGIPDAEVDRFQVGTALGAIAFNAREAMPEGGVVTVEAQGITEAARPGRGSMVRIRITDQGRGIPAENLSRIFDPYFSTKERGYAKGLGLGLAIADSIIRRHQGWIEVESPPGNGATFTVYLPAVPARAAPGAPPTRAGRASAARSRRILILEDELAAATVMIQMLDAIGFGEVDHVPRGEQAITLCARAMNAGEPYGLAILDLTVPVGMGGRETLAKLREIDSDLRAIVCSGYSSDPVMSRFADYGFQGALQKPFGLARLGATVRGILDDA